MAGLQRLVLIESIRALTRHRSVGTDIAAILVDVRSPSAAPESELWRHFVMNSRPVWLCASPTRGGIEATLRVWQRHRAPVLFAGAELPTYSTDQWTEAHGRLVHCVRLAGELHSRIASLPSVAAVQLVVLLAGVAPPTSPKQLAARCGACRRTIDRWLRDAALPPAWLLFAASRVLRAYDEVRCRTATLLQLAHAHGFGTRSTMQRQFAATLDVDPARDDLPPLTDAMLHALVVRLTSDARRHPG